MISVVIPAYNSQDTIAKCLNSLKNQSFQGDYEIILVDSSIDKTPEIVSRDFSEITFIHLDKKTDPGTARNMGIEQAKGDIIAFIDSDCTADCNWLKNIESAHKQGYNILGGAVEIANEQDDLIGWAGYFAEFREFLPELPTHEVTHIPTCNISYKKNVFYKYGMFNGDYYPQEDLVLNHALRQKGERILFNPEIKVFHRHRSSLKNFFIHQEKIGFITARVLKVLELEGSFIARNRALGWLLVPLLPLVKFFRTLFVFLKYKPKSLFARPMAVFIFALGLIFWAWGMIKGIYSN
ncbi:MAG: glycosyltransferase [Candidatus Omnitrophica bacterium]|nr:glycosyltransferase [Candidatus Omnitrophota bacterium]